MCGRYALTYNLAQICAAFGATTALEGGAWPNACTPGMDLPVFIRGRVGLARWGWPVAADMQTIINIRSETAAQKPSFAADAAAGHRCIAPASLFYERDSSGRQMAVTVMDAPLFGLCGLWTRGADGTPHFAILTRAAQGIVTSHGRMPVLCTPETGGIWIQAGATPPAPPLCAKALDAQGQVG